MVIKRVPELVHSLKDRETLRADELITHSMQAGHRTMPWAAILRFTTLLCALGVAQASAQNAVSQRLLELDDAKGIAAFTIMLNESDRRCDQVTRTLFNGSVLGVDEWEASCRDRNAYSASVLAELNEAIITSLSCHELSATSRMLLQMSGSRSKAARCRINQRDGGCTERVAFVP